MSYMSWVLTHWSMGDVASILKMQSLHAYVVG